MVDNNFQVAFRADASIQIGTGHIMRCLTLADALCEKGAKCNFICRDHEGHLIDEIRSRGHAVHISIKSQAKEPLESDLLHEHWLGVDWQTDAAQTRQALGNEPVDWLIVDHYALDHHWETAVRSFCKRIMVIDDLANRRHNCDLLLDHNYANSIERYAELVPAECSQLYGPEFALLKPIYAQRCAEQSFRSGKIGQVLIYFGGGADPMNLTGMALHAFQAPELNKIELDIVVGSSYAYKKELEADALIRGRADIHTQLPDLSELMARADLAIGAGGVTTWERCCLGLPSIVISIADNQRPACEALAVDDLILYLGHAGDITPETIRAQILELVAQPQRLIELSEKNMKLVDGNGIDRVIKAIRQ